MEFKIVSDVKNPVLGRRELMFEVDHPASGTPDRSSIRDNLAKKLKTAVDNVYIVSMKTKTGSQKTYCEVEVYDNADRAKQVVSKHIYTRNLPAEERKKIIEAKKEAKKKAKAKAQVKPK